MSFHGFYLSRDPYTASPCHLQEARDLTHLNSIAYRQSALTRSLGLVLVPGTPACGLTVGGMISRTVPSELREAVLHRIEDLQRKYFSRIQRVGLIPRCLSEYPRRRDRDRKHYSQE